MEEGRDVPAAPIQRVSASRGTPPNRPAPSDPRQVRAENRWGTAPLVPELDDIPF